MKKLSILFTIVAAFTLPVSAQNTSPYWSLAGNSNATTSSKLGTTNSIPLRFLTNNLERMRVTEAGRVGIGTTAPVNILTVKITSGTPASSWITSSAPVFAGFAEAATSEIDLATASNTADLRPVFTGKRSRGTLAAPTRVANNDYLTSITSAAYDGSSFLSPAAIHFYVDGSPASGHVPARISFETGTSRSDRLERLKILNNGDFNFNNGQMFLKQSSGNTGIGTTNPAAKLTVVSTEAASLSTPGHLMLGTTGSYSLAMDFQQIQARNNGSASVLFLNSNGGVTQIGNSSSSYQGLLAAGSSFGVYAYAAASGGTGVYGQAASGGYGGSFYNADGVAVYGKDGGNAQGVLGYETGNGEGVYGQAYGTNGWGVRGFSQQSYGIYGYSANNASYAGYFLGNVFATGMYAGSDKKLKQNIEDFSSAMSIISQLHPQRYQFRQDGNYKLMNLPQGKHYGLIAQEVEKVLPGLVKDTKFEVDRAIPSPAQNSDPKNPATQNNSTVTKTGEVIDFKAVNYTELIPILIKGMQEQQTEIQGLHSQIEELKLFILKNNNGSSANLQGGYLKQNVPNPATSNTVISYYVSDNAGMAQIKLTDIKGSVLKVYNASKGNGQLSIRSGELPAGTYNYTLYVNDNLVDSRKMVITK